MTTVKQIIKPVIKTVAKSVIDSVIASGAPYTLNVNKGIYTFDFKDIDLRRFKIDVDLASYGVSFKDIQLKADRTLSLSLASFSLSFKDISLTYSGDEGGVPVTTGLVDHWDFSDASSVTLNGSNVSEVSNQVGTLALFQDSASRQPPYQTAGVNGLNVLNTVEGEFDRLQTTPSASGDDAKDFKIASDSGTIVVVYQHGYASGRGKALFKTFIPTDNEILGYDDTIGITLTSDSDDPSITTSSTNTGGVNLAQNTMGVVYLMEDKIYINGVDETDNVGALGYPTSLERFFYDMTGKAGELLRYSTQLSQSEINSLQTYFENKWGIA